MNLTSIKLTVTGAQAWATVTGPLTSGMVGLPVTMEYDEAWDGLTKNLVCRCSPWGSDDGEVRTILNAGETAVVAHEVMQPDMYLYLGVEGFRDDGKLVIPTTWAKCGKIEYGANTCEDPSTDPKLSVWNQLQMEMEQTKKYVLTPEQAANIQAYAQEARQAAEEAKQAAENGLYYTPTVSQPTGNTLKFEFKPSVTGAPIPKPVTVELPVSEDSGPNASQSGLSETAKTLLVTILRNATYEADQSDHVDALAAELGVTEDEPGGGDDSGNTGGDETEITVYELLKKGLKTVDGAKYLINDTASSITAAFNVKTNTNYRIVNAGTHNRFRFYGRTTLDSEDVMRTTEDLPLDGIIADNSTNSTIDALKEIEINSGNYQTIYVYLYSGQGAACTPNIIVTEVQ